MILKGLLQGCRNVHTYFSTDENASGNLLNYLILYYDILAKENSTFTPKVGQLPVLDYYIGKCEREIGRGVHYCQQCC